MSSYTILCSRWLPKELTWYSIVVNASLLLFASASALRILSRHSWTVCDISSSEVTAYARGSCLDKWRCAS